MITIKNKRDKNEYGLDVRVINKSSIRSALMYFIAKYIIVLCGFVGLAEMYASAFGIMFDRYAVYTHIMLIMLLIVPASEYLAGRLLIYAAAVVYLYRELTENTEVYKAAVKTIMNTSYGIIRETFSFPAVDGFENVPANGSAEIAALAFAACIVIVVLLSVLVRYRAAAITAAAMAAAASCCIFIGGSINTLAYALISICVFGVFIVRKGYGKIRLFSRRYTKKVRLSSFTGEVMLIASMCLMMLAAVYTSSIITEEKVKNILPETNIEGSLKRTVTDMAALWFSDYKKNTQMNLVSGGQLSFFNSMKITDSKRFRIELVPFTEDKLFFKFYTGSVYKYGENQWYNISDGSGEYAEKISNTLKNSSVEPEKIKVIKSKSEKRIFDSYLSVSDDITYTSDDCFAGNDYVGEYELNIYDDSAYTEDVAYKQFVYDNYLYLSDENRSLIEKICTEQGFSADENLLAKLQDYFNTQFEFAYDTEITPFGKDYVNYFLGESKKGNFVHYASSAVLIYRSLGIPARYVLGYAVPFGQVMSADDKKGDAQMTERSLYYKTKNVAVTDENLYAWVEIYDSQKGWTPCDVSNKVFERLAEESQEEEDKPAPDEKENTEEPKKSKEEEVKAYFADTVNTKTENARVFAKDTANKAYFLAKHITEVIFIVLVLTLVLVFLIHLLLYFISDRNTRAGIIFIRLSALTKVHSGIRDVCTVLKGAGAENEYTEYAERIISKAEYSGKEITPQELRRLEKAYLIIIKSTLLYFILERFTKNKKID